MKVPKYFYFRIKIDENKKGLTVKIEDASDVEVMEVRHGRWIDRPYLMLNSTKFCSLCDSDYKMPYENYNYCPNCGAKMDGGINNG